MQIEDYPGNAEVCQLRLTVLGLEKTNDWGAVELAKTDLFHEIKKRDEWVKQNVNN